MVTSQFDEVRRVAELMRTTPESVEERPKWVAQGNDQTVCNVACTSRPEGEGLEVVINNLVGHVQHNHPGKRIFQVCHGTFDGMWAVFARIAPCC